MNLAAARRESRLQMFGDAVTSTSEEDAAEQLRARRAQEIRAQESEEARRVAADREASLRESRVRNKEAADAMLGPEEVAARLERLESRRAARLRGHLSTNGEASSPTNSVPALNIRFCIDNLNSIRMETGDFTLKDFSDNWAPGNKKTTPNRPNTFVPNCVARWDNPLWAPFYDDGKIILGTDGSQEADPSHPPFFRVSAELLGRMLHTQS